MLLKPRGGSKPNTILATFPDVQTSRNALSGCTVSGTNNINVGMHKVASFWAGQDIEGFHKRKARGELLPHTFFYSKDFVAKTVAINPFKEFQTTDGGTTWCCVNEHTGWTFVGLGTIEDFGDLPEPDLEKFNHLVAGAAAKIYTSGQDSLTFLAELHKVIDMFRNVLKRWLNLVKDLSLDEIANKWLELRYGWRTLIYDLIELEHALNSFDAERKRYSERVGLRWQDAPEVTETTVYDTLTSTIVATTTDVYDTSIRGAVTADITPPRFRFNLAATAWELVPYSFVVDWFLSVGQAIYAASFLLFETDHTASIGFKRVLHRSVVTSATSLSNHPSYKAEFAGGAITQTITVTGRYPTSVSALPSWNVNLDWMKGLDIWALLKQVAGGRGTIARV